MLVSRNIARPHYNFQNITYSWVFSRGNMNNVDAKDLYNRRRTLHAGGAAPSGAKFMLCPSILMIYHLYLGAPAEPSAKAPT